MGMTRAQQQRARAAALPLRRDWERVGSLLRAGSA